MNPPGSTDPASTDPGSTSAAVSTSAVVHLVRHGQVHNPTGVLYGRLPDFHLSPLGVRMADRVAEAFAAVDLVHLVCSPLERAQETMAPIAARHPHLAVHTDGRVIEGGNRLEGHQVGARMVLRHPALALAFRNPLRPSWGEPYTQIVARMKAAIRDAAERAVEVGGDGAQALIVSHQLPIWMARCDAEGRRLPHDPRNRQCSLCSVTTFTLVDGRVVAVGYTEPAADLVPVASPKTFVAGA